MTVHSFFTYEYYWSFRSIQDPYEIKSVQLYLTFTIKSLHILCIDRAEAANSIYRIVITPGQERTIDVTHGGAATEEFTV